MAKARIAEFPIRASAHKPQPFMKSAYELAMERLQNEAPTKEPTERQKAELAELDSVYIARIAEKELFLKEQIAKATIGGAYAEMESLQQQLVREVRRLKEECEEKKEKVRNAE